MPHKFSREIVESALHNDAIHDVEQITGKRWTEFSREDQRLALSKHMKSVDAKRHVLNSMDDVTFGCKLPEFERVITDIGFTLYASGEFTYCGQYKDAIPTTEAWKIWADLSRGLLLFHDTFYNQEKINSGRFYYQWKPREGISWQDRCGCTSSGSIDKTGVWHGYHDCREAVRYSISKLEEHGEFIVPWNGNSPSTIWFSHCGDPRVEGMDLSALYRAMDERFAQLPPEVKRVFEKGRRPH